MSTGDDQPISLGDLKAVCLAFTQVANTLLTVHELTRSGYPSANADDIILEVHLLTRPITFNDTREGS